MNSSQSARLRSHVEHLAALGEKSTRRPTQLAAAADYIERHFREAGLNVERQSYSADGIASTNLDAFAPGFSRASSHLLIGAHYDSALWHARRGR